MGNNSEKSVDGEIHMMDIARFGSSTAKPKRMLALATLLLSMAAFPIQQAHAMANFTEVWDAEWADLTRIDTCGNCHFSWSGADTRGNFGMDYWLYDFDTMDSGMATAMRTIDSDHDGVDNATEFDNGQVGLAPAPMVNFPDKDGDGYIMMYYRTDNTGLPVDNDGQVGNAPDVAPLGWDIDDNDAGQGNQAWGTDNPGSTTDTTPPNAVSDFRSGALDRKTHV